MTIDVRTNGAYHLVVERSAPDGALDGISLARLAVEGLFALADPLFQPLDIEVALVCHDTESGFILDERPANPFRQLRLAGRDEGVNRSATYGGAVVEETTELNQQRLLEWLAVQLDYACDGPDSSPGWSELIVNSVDARLPAAAAIGEIVHVRYYGEDFPYPVRSTAYGDWASGPLPQHSDTTPFHVTVDCDAGELTIDASLTWSLWTSPDMPGHDAVRRALQSLHTLGWRDGEGSDFSPISRSTTSE